MSELKLPPQRTSADLTQASLHGTGAGASRESQNLFAYSSGRIARGSRLLFDSVGIGSARIDCIQRLAEGNRPDFVVGRKCCALAVFQFAEVRKLTLPDLFVFGCEQAHFQNDGGFGPGIFWA